jgi:hypothetical protein
MKIVEARPFVMGLAWCNLTFVVVRTDYGLEGVDESLVQHCSVFREEPILRSTWNTLQISVLSTARIVVSCDADASL